MELLEKLGINPVLLVTQIINFLVLLFILKKFLYKPILEMLERRRTKILEGLKKAQEIEKKYQETERVQEEKLYQARVRAGEILQEAKERVEKMQQEILKKSEKEAEVILEKAKKEIENERLKMLQEVRSEIAYLVVLALQKILAKELDKRTQERLVKDAIEDVNKLYKDN